MTDYHLQLDRPYRESDPLDMNDAREAARRGSRMRRDAEAEHRRLIEDAGEKEGTYRQRLAEEIVRAKVDNPATVAVDVAKGEVKVELIAYRVAEGMVKAQEQRLRTLEGERSMLKSLIDWSATIANVLREPEDRPATETFGRRAA